MKQLTETALRDLLRGACERAGSQLAFAESAGFSSAYISDVLAGKRDPSSRLAEVLGYSRSIIFTKNECRRCLIGPVNGAST